MAQNSSRFGPTRYRNVVSKLMGLDDDEDDPQEFGNKKCPPKVLPLRRIVRPNKKSFHRTAPNPKYEEKTHKRLKPSKMRGIDELSRDIVRCLGSLNQFALSDYTNGTIHTAMDGNHFSRALSTSSSCSSSSASSSRSLRKYDVFISFKGDDVRSGFKSHLQDALRVKKIETYIDDRIDKGDELWPALVKAIQDSVLFLVIFSQNYASSSWCLRELGEILESTKSKKRRVLPVLYNISPSEVRYQKGSYKRAFTKHENDHRLEKEEVSKWRHNLTFAANLAGWDSSVHRDEAALTQEIVARVAKKLDYMFQSVYSDGVFGIGNQIEHIESLLRNDSTEDVQFIGIWGMVGIGKTTVATQLFNKLCLEFESTCFFDNLREESEKNGISFLKKKLYSTLLDEESIHSIILSGSVMRRLRRKKVLIVLDDVNYPQLLTNLVGVPNQFGKGSRVIITARDKQVFGKFVKDNHTYEVKALGSADALQLFKFYAFNNNCCDKEFEQLSQKVVDYANGIPSTLIALASFLYGKSTEEWQSRLEKIIKIPYTEIQQILKLSYDGMDDEKKNILLDIASTLKGRSVEHIKKLLDAFGNSQIEGLTKILEGQSSDQWKKECDEKRDPTDEDKENKDVSFDEDQAQ